ncbi:hypothetical protein E2M54_03365 [Salmonella enterica subsp. enterica serovar Nima]|uniref:Uncharacterized protein n=2 Tax=Salmonella enterica TaxID=28901 RepID=A0A744Z7C2_SALER|nr:hypothetical protein [Salmonella enterica]EBV4569805.1 hypothetical protein [Salmonella enterica subsp. enterica serovar Nima]ECC3263590.1 hypothetical protein [Salmonella enterica subsp. enterica]ECT9452510.1 hypothetical protein [Salmonella enterica subsp. enterica serovar Oskarshamn]EAO8270204.1 hypothetical protein [Salmonella enterica]
MNLNSTTEETNLPGGELNGVGLTGHTYTGAPCGAPAQPTIEVWPNARHKKDANASYVAGMIFGRPIPAPEFAGTRKRYRD